VLGELDGCPILASETCALDIIGAKYVRDVEPGEVIVFDEQGARKAINRFRQAAAALHLRIHLLFAAGFHRRRAVCV
jgi:glutamine phosphoribosylpyrophosphate amidotransferase